MSCFFLTKKRWGQLSTRIKSIGSNEEEKFSDGAHDLRVCWWLKRFSLGGLCQGQNPNNWPILAAKTLLSFVLAHLLISQNCLIFCGKDERLGTQQEGHESCGILNLRQVTNIYPLSHHKRILVSHFTAQWV